MTTTIAKHISNRLIWGLILSSGGCGTKQINDPAAHPAAFTPLPVHVGNQWTYEIRTEYDETSRVDIDTVVVCIETDTTIWVDRYDSYGAYRLSRSFWDYNHVYYSDGSLHGRNFPSTHEWYTSPGIIFPKDPVISQTWGYGLQRLTMMEDDDSLSTRSGDYSCIRLEVDGVTWPRAYGYEWWAHDIGMIRRILHLVSSRYDSATARPRLDTTTTTHVELIAFQLFDD